MNGWFSNLFARRYVLGLFLLVGTLLIFTWKFFQIGAPHPIGLLRSYVVLLVLFSPWFFWTYFTRLHVVNDQVKWREFPLPRSFSLQDVTAIVRVDEAEPGGMPRLRVEYMHDNAKRQTLLTPYIFPKADARAFLHILADRRPDLHVPDFPLEPARSGGA